MGRDKTESVRVSFETFRRPTAYELRQMECDAPSVGNGDVHFRKWRVTVEPVEESVEFLRERLQEMWDVATNHHHRDALRREARKLGVELVGRPGEKARGK